MERFCGHLKRGGADSKKLPYKSLDRYLFDWTLLWHLGAIYNVRDELKLKKSKAGEDGHKNDDRLEIPGCKFKNLAVLLFTYVATDSGGVLTGKQQLSVDTHSDIFLLVLGDVVRYFPETQVNPSVVWRVQDALTAATFIEWAKFKKSNSQDVFSSASRYSQKAGGRDSRYARVSHFPCSEARLC